VLTNSTITTTGESGTGIHSEFASFGEPPSVRPSTVTAANTTVTTSGADAIGAFAIFGGTVNLNGSTVITTGPPHFNTDGATGIYSLGGFVNNEFLGSTINITGSSVTTKQASAAQVVNASVMNITNSTLNGGMNGIRISDNDHTPWPGHRHRVEFRGKRHSRSLRRSSLSGRWGGSKYYP
jgi:hypothetical protein